MSGFVVSARKYRPVRFDEVVGQEHVSNTLKNALRSDHLAHAFLFCGPRGVGKTTCARILAKVLNCQNPTSDFEPCNTCTSCQSFAENASFNITELDAASNNSVEHIRSLIEQVRFQPQQGKYKIFIIDEVHMLSQQAFNAFLKTLEEPPPYAIFILATTEKHKIIPTILSRCQIFDFKRIQVEDIVSHLNGICAIEKITAEPDALHIIGQKADGALRDALSIFDRMVSVDSQQVTYEAVIENLNILDYDYYFRVVDALLLEDRAQTFLIFDEILRKGFDPDLFINGLAEHLRNLLVGKDTVTLQLLEVGDRLRERYARQSAQCPTDFLLTALHLCNDCDINYRLARHKRLHVEMYLIRLASIGRVFRLSEAQVGADTPEKKTLVETDAPAPAAPAPPPAAPVGVVADENGVSPQAAPAAEQKASPFVLQSIDLNTILAEEQASMGAPEVVTSLDEEAVRKSWADYLEKTDRTSLKVALKAVHLSVEDTTVLVRTGSNRYADTVRQETELVDFLRSRLRASNLLLRIEVDEELRKKRQPKTVLSPRDIYKLMLEDNPHISDLQKRFDLHPD